MIKAENISMRYLMNTDRIQSMKEYVVKFLKREIKYKEFCEVYPMSRTILNFRG